MSWVSFVIVAIIFFVPPLELSARVCCSADIAPIVFSLGNRQITLQNLTALFILLFLSWFALWTLLTLGLRFLTPGPVDGMGR